MHYRIQMAGLTGEWKTVATANNESIAQDLYAARRALYSVGRLRILDEGNKVIREEKLVPNFGGG